MAAWRFLIETWVLRAMSYGYLEVSLDVVKRLAIATQFSISLLQAQKMTSQNLVVSYVGTLAIAFVVGGFKISVARGGFEAQIWYRFGSNRPEPSPPPPIEPGIPSVIPE